MTIPHTHSQRASIRALTPSTTLGSGWRFAFKEAADPVLALLALLVLAPLLLMIAVGVYLSSSGPVIFRQRRVGRGGVTFDLLKFRTMVEDEDAAGFTPALGVAPGGIEGTDRRTALGRWLRASSLDELPQLLNVVNGEMSLIGPRPERPEFVALFEAFVPGYSDRHRVKSGITGWAQAHGLRGATSITDRVQFDNYYIENWSPALDLRILALTVLELLRFRGARPHTPTDRSADHATTPSTSARTPTTPTCAEPRRRRSSRPAKCQQRSYRRLPLVELSNRFTPVPRRVDGLRPGR